MGIAKERRRFVIGENDLIIGARPELLFKGQKEMSGYDCGSSYQCLNADNGSGFYIVQGSEFKKVLCDKVTHGIFWNSDPVVGSTKWICDHTDHAHDWSMKNNLDWLAKTATGQIPPSVGDDFEGSA